MTPRTLLCRLLGLVGVLLPGVVGQGSQRAECPLPGDILPCVCSLDPDGSTLNMDCSQVVDEAQLAGVFQANFPTSAFGRLTIFQNEGLKTLESGVLSDVSFTEVWITDGVLEEVQSGAFSSSVATVRSLIFNFNSISSFPFADLESFTALQSLDLRNNALMSFPTLNSASLQVMYLSHNPLLEVPADAFAGMPSIIDLHLSNTSLTQFYPGTLGGLTKLRNVGLGNNQLTQLDADAVQCNANTGLVDVGYNKLSSVSPGAFPGLEGAWLYIHHNHLTVLEEEIWRSKVENDGYLDPYGNPLLCGCDLAWLIRDPVLLDAIDVYTTCADGRLVTELDPADFAHC